MLSMRAITRLASSRSLSSAIMERSEQSRQRDEELYAVLGRATFNWSHIDVAIDFCNLTLYRSHGGSAIDRELPRTALHRKIEFFRKVVAASALSEAHKGFGAEIVSELEALS